MLRTIDLEMARKRRTFKIDDRILDGVKVAARKTNSSENNWVETLLMETLIASGILPKDFEPLKENRGGLRQSSSEGSDND